MDARFAVAGGGPLLQAMVKAVNDAGLKSRTVFLGELGPLELRHVYAAADVFHAPSEIEGIARSLYEAMAMGCVPVVADVGGQRELVTAECGFLLPHGPRELERYIDALKSASSPELRTRLGAAARARIVGSFNSAQCVSAFEAIFDSALERRASAQEPSESAAAARELALMGLEISRRHFWRAVQLRAAVATG